MKSYLVFLGRNKLYTAIQIFGLSVALGFVILLLSYARKEYMVGKTHPLSEEIYVAGTGNALAMTVGTAPELFPEIPQIKEWTRVGYPMLLPMMVNDKLFSTDALAVDSTFFSFFGYELQGADRRKLFSSVTDIIISRSFANKVFPDKDPVGSIMYVKDKDTPCTVIGVVEDFDGDDIFKPADILISMSFEEDRRDWMSEFGSICSFVKLADGTTDEDAKQALLKAYKRQWNFWPDEPDGDYSLSGVSLTPLCDVYFTELLHQYRSGNKNLVLTLLAVALVLLVSAMFNYVNLTVALAGKRAKEIATRRLLGDSVWQVVGRSLTESFLFTSVCFLLGCLVAVLSRPGFEKLLDAEIVFLADAASIAVGAVTLLMVAILSGVIPAVIVSRFKPIDVMKGSFRLLNKMWLSRFFIVAQNVVNIVLVALGLTMAAQMYHLHNLPMGYNTKHLAVVDFAQGHGGLTFKNCSKGYEMLKSLPCVKRIGVFRTMPWTANTSSQNIKDEQGIDVPLWMSVSCMDSTCFSMLGFDVVEQYVVPGVDKVWVDTEARDRLKLSEQRIRLLNRDVCGVVNDFRSYTAMSSPGKQDIHNVLMQLDPNGYITGFLVEMHDSLSTSGTKAFDAVKACCDEIQKMVGYETVFEMAKTVEDILAEPMKEQRNTMKLVICFMLLFLFISALGMLAMSVSYTEQQSKQIALRKVMGATVEGAAWELSRPFLLLSLLSSVIAVPISIKGMREYLEPFYYRIDFPWWVLVVAVLVSLSVAVLSVLWQTLSVARRNPVESIRTE